MTTKFGMGLMGFLLLTACNAKVTDLGGRGGDDDDDGLPGGPDVVMLSATDRLVRASMALRGTRPSVDELKTVHDDPSQLEAIVETYTDTEEFYETIRDLHADDFLTRDNRFTFPSVQELNGFTGYEINGSLTEEPLKLIEYVVATDRPYTEIVTASYTLTDPIVSRAWGIPYAGTGGTWAVTSFDDQRPHAGILSSTGLFARHESNGGNYQRSRANLISRTLLCYDFAAADVTIDTNIDLSDPDAVENAVKTNAACLTCHTDLDPLAGFFFGWDDRIRFANLRNDAQNGVDVYPIAFYDRTRENRWQNTTERAPKYFGQDPPGNRLSDLGEMIAADPRFASCAARRFFAWFSHMEKDQVSPDVVDYLTQKFVDSGYDAKLLAREIVLSEPFAVSHATTEEKAATVAGFKRARPEQLVRLMRDLTGYEWKTDASFNAFGYPFGIIDVSKNDQLGLRTLAGGMDSRFVNTPSRSWNVTTSLYLRTFAANAAGTVVDADFAKDPAARRLLANVSPTETSESAIRAQLAWLHLRLYGEVVEPADVDDTWALFSAALASSGSVTEAWKTTLTAMLQDIRVAYY